MEIIITIIGLLIAAVTFYFSFYRKPTQELNHLRVQFRATQTLSLSVQKDIENYAHITNSWDKQMFSNITFRTYLLEMKDSYRENLSDELYERLSTLKLTKPNIESMTKSLEDQFRALQQIQTETKILVRQISQ